MSNLFDRRIPVNDTTAHVDELAHQEPAKQHPSAMAPSDAQGTSTIVKRATQELLKHGYLEEASKQELFRSAIIHEREIAAVLEPLDLALRLDTHRGVAFLIVASSTATDADDDAWTHPLVRRQRLTLEQSLLVAILRQAFVIHEQDSGVGQRAAKVSVDDLLPQLLTYFGDSGSDAKNETRLLNLLEQLKPYGFVSEVDKQHEVTIRPLIAHLANPESLAALLTVLKKRSPTNAAAEHDL